MASGDPAQPLMPDLGSASDNESASDYASGLENEVSSLSSDARNYVFENGRRYHGYKEGRYLVPNDEKEKDRMDLFHHFCLLVLRGELFAAPVGMQWNPQRILDVGTGTGIWAMDIADQYPQAEVIGIDLSPIQPQMVPPNLIFEVGDIEEIWPYQENSFDFIHIRGMAGHIADWPRLYQQAFKALKPGGWIEFQNLCDHASCDDNSVPPKSFFVQSFEYFEKASLMIGRQNNSVALGVVKALKDSGYVEVGENMVKAPVGCWPEGIHEREIGMYLRQAYLDGVEAYCAAPFTRVLGWDKKELADFHLKAIDELKNPGYHFYSKLYFVFGRKP